MRFFLFRSLIFALVAIILVATGFFTKKYWHHPSPEKKQVIEVVAKPNVRPERLDLALFTQYSGQSMDQILGAVEATNPGVVATKSAAATLINSLPHEPYPFSAGAKPVNEIALKQFVESIEGGKLGTPSMVDRWRYNLASAALGKSGDALPEKLRLRTLPTVKTENFPVTMTEKSMELSGPLAIGNFDGVEGLEMVSHGGSKLWTLKADGTLSALQGLDGTVPGSAIYPADYDQDGDLDLFISRRSGVPNSLLQNDGKGNFNDVTVDAGLLAFSDTATAAWMDYDQDGLLDLLVGNFDHPFEFYRQVSSGKFEPVSWELDLWIPHPVAQIEVADLNNDTYPDLILSISGMVNQLRFSIPSTDPLHWRFLEKGGKNVLPGTIDTQSIATFDLDNDGDLDLLLGKATGDSENRISTALNEKDHVPENHLQLFLNDGEGVFTNVTEGSGLEGVEDVQSIHVLDLDNDGFEDIYAVTGDLAFNRTFWNRGGIQFRDVSQASHLNYLNSPETMTSIDVDNNGALDLFLCDENGEVTWLEAQSTNGWLDLNLTNSPPGTRINILTRDTDWILQPIHRVTGLIPEMTVGLGQVDKVEQIEVFPPQSVKPVITLKKVLPNRSVDINLPEKNSQAPSPTAETPS